MAQKSAIFDPTDQAALLGVCESDNEFVPIWLMMRCGMHPSDITNARTKFTFNNNILMWKRAKNSNPRREMIPPDTLVRLETWFRRGRKLERSSLFRLVRRVGERVGHHEYSPMTLRHTFCLEQLRYYNSLPRPPPDFISLVAKKMGCTRDVVVQNYIDLTDWEKLGGV